MCTNIVNNVILQISVGKDRMRWNRTRFPWLDRSYGASCPVHYRGLFPSIPENKNITNIIISDQASFDITCSKDSIPFKREELVAILQTWIQDTMDERRIPSLAARHDICIVLLVIWNISGVSISIKCDITITDEQTCNNILNHTCTSSQ